MSDEQSQERTEEPTPKRLQEAKRKGQVARSRELNTALMLTVGALMLYYLGPPLGQGLMVFMAQALSLGPKDLADPLVMLQRIQKATLDMVLLFTPLLLALLGTALAAPALLGGWAFSAESLAPKLERVNPLSGLGRIFSTRGLVELVKAIAKVLLVAGIGGAFLWFHRAEILAAPKALLAHDLFHAFRLFGIVLIVLAAATFLIALIDVPYQLWDHKKKLKMTLQEVRDEAKESEGRPEVKSRIRQLQREFSRRRMMDEVSKADLVVTNPTHYAVALRYEPLKSGAPRVVAKGADLMAMQIRTIAKTHGVSVIEAPALARAIYHGVKLGQQIPASLYLAVAQLLAYVYQLRTARETGAQPPAPPRDLPVPAELLDKNP